MAHRARLLEQLHSAGLVLGDAIAGGEEIAQLVGCFLIALVLRPACPLRSH